MKIKIAPITPRKRKLNKPLFISGGFIILGDQKIFFKKLIPFFETNKKPRGKKKPSSFNVLTGFKFNMLYYTYESGAGQEAGSAIAQERKRDAGHGQKPQ